VSNLALAHESEPNAGRNEIKKGNTPESLPEISFRAALILQQKSAFSLNDSHAFNRADDAYTQDWQRDTASRWNLNKKTSRTSLHLLRLHIAFIFVLCASVAFEVTQLSALKSDN
jgi:hypothetical protein